MLRFILVALAGAAILATSAKPNEPHTVNQTSAATMCEAGFYNACLNSDSFRQANY